MSLGLLNFLSTQPNAFLIDKARGCSGHHRLSLFSMGLSEFGFPQQSSFLFSLFATGRAPPFQLKIMGFKRCLIRQSCDFQVSNSSDLFVHELVDCLIVPNAFADFKWSWLPNAYLKSVFDVACPRLVRSDLAVLLLSETNSSTLYPDYCLTYCY